mmetsp:Transcript_6511/g.13421  ORF Transcript_6511/g.13421 Transcript_6511/m.13421 type:complete len:256 (+) Transcript_6511:873-1640(+)
MHVNYWITASFRELVVTGPADVNNRWGDSFSSDHIASPSPLALRPCLARSKAFKAPLLFIIGSGSLVSMPSTDKSSPFGTSEGTLSNSTFSSLPSAPSDAARNMAVLSMPRILAGFRFVTATIFFPTISSIGIFPASPATTVRYSGLPSSALSPQSALHTRSASASGWGPASMIVAARKATLRMSSTGPFFSCICRPPRPRAPPPLLLPRLRCFLPPLSWPCPPHVSRSVTTRLKTRLSVPVDSLSSAKYPLRSN